MKQFNTVSSCAILFGIPVTLAQFRQSVQSSDYVTALINGRNPDVAWRLDYAHVAQAAQQLIRTARELGARIYERATINDLTNATRNYEYVVIFAHWRGAIFHCSDVFCDLDELKDRLASHPLLKFVLDNNSSMNELIDALNAEIESGRLLSTLPEVINEACQQSKSIGQTLCRDLLDEALIGLVRPGNRLELSDGLHNLDAVEASIWVDFSGELDFEVCNSQVIATFIDIRRGCQISHLHWSQYLLPGPQYLKVEIALKIMSSTGCGYLESRLFVEEQE